MENYGVFLDIGPEPEIAAQIVIGTLFSLILWWLEAKRDYDSSDTVVGIRGGIRYDLSLKN